MGDKRKEHLIHRIREIIVELSGLESESLSEDATFLELGFDSLFLTQLSASLQKAFGLRITFRQLFCDLPTIAALGTYLDEKLPVDKQVEPSVAVREKTHSIPIESAALVAVAPTEPVVIAPPPAAQTLQEVDGAEASFPISAGPLDLEGLTVTGLESLILRQLSLMEAQLGLLQALPSQTGLPVAANVEKPAPPAIAEVTVPFDVAACSESPSPAIAQQVQAPREKEALNPPTGFGPSVTPGIGLHSLPANQQRHLDNLIEKYTRKTAGSKERTQRYRRYHADPRTASGYSRRWKEMVYPIWVQRSLGSKLWDVDGNEYIDLLNGFGPHFLGHAPAYVTQALEEQLQRGFEIGPQTPLAGEAAEMICQLTGMDRASFTCTGSEAVQAAMRLARTFTCRDKVVVFSRDYHGNFDQVLVREANRAGHLHTVPSAPGIPLQSVDDTYVMEYGTDESLELIKKHAGQIAAVMVEPVQSRRPEFQPREFLHELRRITRENEIVLIFDEVVTGFRCAPGGAQAYFGVEADLATYGKVIGGGMPIGVVAGRSALMDTFDGGFWQYGDDSFPGAGVTFFAGTFVRHPLSIAAAHAALKYLIQQGPALQQRVANKADLFAGQVNSLFRQYEIDIELPHFTSQMFLRIKEQSELSNLLTFHLRYRGVHILENFPCYMTDAHTPEDIQYLVGAFTESVETMVETGIFGNPSKLVQANKPETAKPPSQPITERPQQLQAPSTSGIPVEYPPTDLQREMWVAAQIRPEASAASNGSNVVELVGELKIVELEQAIEEVIRRHEALRSTFSEDGSKVVVHPSAKLDLHIHDLSSFSAAESAARLTEILERDGRHIFDLVRGPLASFRLIKLATTRHLLVFSAQMIICDGWGFKVALEEISGLYSAFLERRNASLDAPIQMHDYSSWQTQERSSESARECQDFWLAQLKPLPSPLDLAAPLVRPRIRTYEAARTSIRLTPDAYQNLKQAARKLRNTAFELLLTVYALWLYRLSGNEDFVIGVPFSGQGFLGFNTLVGQCVHTVPFRFRLNASSTLAKGLEQTRKMILDAQDHWSLNLGSLISKLDIPNDPGRIPLVPVLFNLDPALSSVQFSRCDASITSGPRFYFHYDLGFNLVDEGETLLVECDYNVNLFDSNSIDRWIGDFQMLLQESISDPDREVGQKIEMRQRPLPVSPQRNDQHGSSKTGAEEYVAPRNDVEKRVARLWCETLTLEKVSSTANFFDLGGHSLAAVSLFAKIESEFGKKLPLATLFTAPTVRKLSAALQENTLKTTWSPLVAIQPQGAKPPLFLVHGAGGNVLLYRALGEHLAPDHPLYGFQSVGLDGESQPLETVEEMAARYVRELRIVQPRGPYHLGGYCLGGTIAYEMGQILHRAGEEVEFVAMLDTYNYSLALKVSFSSFLFQKAKFHLANIWHLHPRYTFKYLSEKVRLGLGGEIANLKTSMPGSSSGEGVNRANGGVEGKVQTINDYAAEHYDPAPYPGRVIQFKPRFNYKFYPDPRLGWGDLVHGELEIIEVGVHPHAMLLEPYVGILAAQLKQHIATKPCTADLEQAGDSSFGQDEQELIGLK